MAGRENCSGCEVERPTDAPFGLCPSCLLKDGLEDVTISFGPATSSILASFGEAFGNIPPILLRDPNSALHPSPVMRPSTDAVPDSAGRSARLQIFGEIARGGMGAVLKGRDADLGRELAVKVLLESHRDKPEMVRRFVEEAQIAGQLQHPGIVPVYELGALGDRRPYFAMKLVKGETLAEVMASRKSPSEGLPRFLTILESICQTMAYAHARGVIHRDLKPSNVMVGSFGEVQVMDWGLAKVLPRGGVADDVSAGRTKEEATVIATARSESESDLSMAGSIMGTPAYMAPEQAHGEIKQLDQRADVFAIGSIFCEMLTGQPAFVGRNSGEIQRKAARGELADALSRLDAQGPGCDPELVGLAKACLASERDDRPRHAGEVAEKLADYHARVQTRLRQSEIERAEEQARAQEAAKRATVEMQRRRLTAGLAASIVGFVVLGAGGWAYVAQQRAARQSATEQAVGESLSKATLLRGQAQAAPVGELTKWTEAITAAKQAQASLQTGEPSRELRVPVIGEELYGMGQLGRARELIEKKLECDRISHLSDLHATLAAIHTEQGNRTQAFEPFRNAFIHTKQDDDGSQMMTTFGQWQVPMECSGTTEQVVAAYRAWFAGKAIGNRMVDQYPDLLVKIRKTEEAIAVYREAISRKGGERYLYSLSELLVNAKRPDEAIELYRQAIAKKPKDIDLRQSLARLYGLVGKPTERLAQLNEVVAIYQEGMKTEPKVRSTIRGLADVYMRLGKKDEAREIYREWIKNVTHALSLNSFAMDYAANYDPKDRDGELAVEAATKACELTSYGDSMYLDTLATAYAEKGDFDAAVKWQLKAIELLDDSESSTSREECEKNLKLFRAKKTVPPSK